jgi:hypothetical protein
MSPQGETPNGDRPEGARQVSQREIPSEVRASPAREPVRASARHEDSDSTAEVVVADEEQARNFYRALLYELAEHARSGGTAIGAAVVAKRVAIAHGLDVAHVPLPRLTRAEELEAGVGKRAR